MDKDKDSETKAPTAKEMAAAFPGMVAQVNAIGDSIKTLVDDNKAQQGTIGTLMGLMAAKWGVPIPPQGGSASGSANAGGAPAAGP